MTFDEAVKALGNTSGWRLVPFLSEWWAIRNAQGQCPLEALAQTTGWLGAVEILHMPTLDAVRLACAADWAIAAYSQADRHALLVACGLEATESA